MEEHVEEHKAVRIIHCNHDQKLELDEEVLQKILLNEHVRDCYVSVVSIAGTFRQGKSFLLNFFLRYLRKIVMNNNKINPNPDQLCEFKISEKGDIVEWLKPEDGPLNGFEWASGSKRYTTGIHIWPEIFRIVLPTGEKVAIILVDTQGSFDNQSSMGDCANIFALSSLISSVQIYNLMRKITQYDFNHLLGFSGYGALVTESQAGKAFQNLCFLIRDWPNPHEHPYGAEGGSCYLNETFSEADENPALKPQIDVVRGLFEQINSYLLPYPGRTVDTSPKFNGDLNDIDDLFKEHVQDFVRTILAPQNIVLKTVGGEKIIAKELHDYIVACCRSLEDESLPKMEDRMFRATVERHYKTLYMEARKQYKKEMDNLLKSSPRKWYNIDELYYLHVQKTSDASKYYESMKKFEHPELFDKYLVILKNDCDEEYKEYRKLNEEQRKKEEAEQQRRREEQRKREEQRRQEAQRKKEQQRRQAGNSGGAGGSTSQSQFQVSPETIGTAAAVIGTIGVIGFGIGKLFSSNRNQD